MIPVSPLRATVLAVAALAGRPAVCVFQYQKDSIPHDTILALCLFLQGESSVQ